MLELAIAAALSFLTSLALTPLIRDTFLRLKIVDAPGETRKVHHTAIPRVGGIAIATSYAASLAALVWMHPQNLPWRDDPRLLAALAAAAVCVFATGLVDDLMNLRPWQKLAGQLTGASLLCAVGVRIYSIAGMPVPDWLGVPLTIAWLLIATNALNLTDGLDGLAAGMGLFASATMIAAAAITGSEMLMLATIPLAASLAGFLRYNFNPASVFLGDCGSLLVGFLLGSYAIIWSQKSATLIGMAAPLLTLAIPLIEVGLSVLRRWLRGQPIFRADRNHIHHKLLDGGLSHRGTVLVLYVAAVISAVLALAQSIAPVGAAAAALLLFVALAGAGIRKLRYLELDCVGQALSPRVIRRAIRNRVAQEEMSRRMRNADSIEECWQALRDGAAEMGFCVIEAKLGARAMCQHQLESANLTRTLRDAPPLWYLRIPLGGADYIQMAHAFRPSPEPELAYLAAFVRNEFESRLTGERQAAATAPLTLPEPVR